MHSSSNYEIPENAYVRMPGSAMPVPFQQSYRALPNANQTLINMALDAGITKNNIDGIAQSFMEYKREEYCDSIREGYSVRFTEGRLTYRDRRGYVGSIPFHRTTEHVRFQEFSWTGKIDSGSISGTKFLKYKPDTVQVELSTDYSHSGYYVPQLGLIISVLPGKVEYYIPVEYHGSPSILTVGIPNVYDLDIDVGMANSDWFINTMGLPKV